MCGHILVRGLYQLPAGSGTRARNMARQIFLMLADVQEVQRDLVGFRLPEPQGILVDFLNITMPVSNNTVTAQILLEPDIGG